MVVMLVCTCRCGSARLPLAPRGRTQAATAAALQVGRHAGGGRDGVVWCACVGRARPRQNVHWASVNVCGYRRQRFSSFLPRQQGGTGISECEATPRTAQTRRHAHWATVHSSGAALVRTPPHLPCSPFSCHANCPREKKYAGTPAAAAQYVPVRHSSRSAGCSTPPAAAGLG